MARVLVVDDDQVVREVIGKYLERDGHAVVEAGDGVRGRQLFEEQAPELVVLDVMLPGVDGLELCRWIRARSEVPVILLTALAEEADRVVGLELGADDYVTKPFSPRELAARVKTVLRRTAAPSRQREPVTVGALTVDPAAREVARRGTPIKLSALEFDLLWFLAGHPNVVFSREQLLHQVWGFSGDSGLGAVTVQVRRLREKVEDDPSRPTLIQTVWGVGYRLVP